VEEQIDASCGVLKEIGAGEKSVIAAFNKIDLLADDSRAKRYGRRFASHVTISALRGEGVDTLLDAIETELSKLMTSCHLSIPQANAALISRIYEEGNVVSRKYEGNNVIVEAELPPGLAHEVEPYRK